MSPRDGKRFAAHRRRSTAAGGWSGTALGRARGTPSPHTRTACTPGVDTRRLLALFQTSRASVAVSRKLVARVGRRETRNMTENNILMDGAKTSGGTTPRRGRRRRAPRYRHHGAPLGPSSRVTGGAALRRALYSTPQSISTRSRTLPARKGRSDARIKNRPLHRHTRHTHAARRTTQPVIYTGRTSTFAVNLPFRRKDGDNDGGAPLRVAPLASACCFIRSYSMSRYRAILSLVSCRVRVGAHG